MGLETFMGPITVAALCRSQEQDGGVSLLQPRQPQPATNALSACRLDRAAAVRPAAAGLI